MIKCEYRCQGYVKMLVLELILTLSVLFNKLNYEKD